MCGCKYVCFLSWVFCLCMCVCVWPAVMQDFIDIHPQGRATKQQRFLISSRSSPVMAAAMKYNGRSDEEMEGWRDRQRGRKGPGRTGIDHNEELKLLNHEGFTRCCCCCHCWMRLWTISQRSTHTHRDAQGLLSYITARKVGSGFFRCYFHVWNGFCSQAFRACLCASLECLSDQILQSRTTSDRQYKFASCCISQRAALHLWRKCRKSHTHAYKEKTHGHTTHIGYLMYLPQSIIYIPPTSSLPLLQYLQQLFLALWDIKPLAGFYRWQCASVGASWGRACTQPCRTEEDHIEIFKGNALALDGGVEAA